MSQVEINLLIGFLAYLPFLTVNAQFLWIWALHDVREKKWKEKTWLCSINLMDGGLPCPPINFVLLGTLIPMIIALTILFIYGAFKALIAAIPFLYSSIVGSIVCTAVLLVFIPPLLVYVYRIAARKREQMMAKLGQSEVPHK